MQANYPFETGPSTENGGIGRGLGASSPSGGRPAIRLLDQVRHAARARHLSRNTEKAYVFWVRRFVLFHGRRHPREMREPEVNAFLTDLAVAGGVAAATQNQALSGLLFLYADVLHQPLDRIEGVVRAKRPRRLPTVLSAEEIDRVLAGMSGQPRVIATLLYGAGLRLTEALQLRVKDVDFSRNELLIRQAKGGKDRVAVLPQCLRARLMAHLRDLRDRHGVEVQRGRGRVKLPGAYAEASGCGAIMGLAVGISRGWRFFRPRGPQVVSPSHAPDRRSTGRAGCGSAFRNRQKGFLPHVPAFVCDPPAAGRL